MNRLPWKDMDVQRTSMLGLLRAKNIEAVTSFGEKFSLVIGFNRHGFRVIFICAHGYYARVFDTEREAELIATEFANELEQFQSKKILNKFGFQRIGENQ